MLHVTTYFRTAAAKELYLIDQVRLVLPVSVAVGGPSTAVVTYAVPAPQA